MQRFILFFLFETLRLKIMLILYQLLLPCRRFRLVVIVVIGVLSLLLASRLRSLIVEVGIVGVSSLFLFRRFWQRHPFLCLRPSASATCRCCRLHWVSYPWRRLIVVVVVKFSL